MFITLALLTPLWAVTLALLEFSSPPPRQEPRSKKPPRLTPWGFSY